MKIRIVAPDIWNMDAVGNYCLDLAELLSINSIDNCLYSQNFSSEETPFVRKVDTLFSDIKEDDIIFLSYSIYDKYLERIIELPHKKFCYFHGVTPANLLEEFEPITAELCRRSVDQFTLLNKFDKVVANSKYIASGLSEFVNKDISVLPPIFPSRAVFSDNETYRKNNDFLVVGRVVPHKKVENALSLFRRIKDVIPEANLKVIGSMPNATYNDYLKRVVREHNLDASVEFKGMVDDEQLKKHYGESMGFINASLHEGFSIPTLEALFYGLTIFVQEGHAAEELLSSDISALDFSKLDELNVKEMLDSNVLQNPKSHVKSILDVNNIDNIKKLLSLDNSDGKL